MNSYVIKRPTYIKREESFPGQSSVVLTIEHFIQYAAGIRMLTEKTR